ncbi:hypothetical protein [Streptomyces sp. NPDC001714]
MRPIVDAPTPRRGRSVSTGRVWENSAIRLGGVVGDAHVPSAATGR